MPFKTATNPDTGETVVLIGDQWQKAEKTATGGNGKKAYLVDGKWLSDTADQPGWMQATKNVLDQAAYKAGGAVTDLAAKVFPPEVAGGIGYAANVAAEAVPALFGGEAAKLMSPALESGAKKLMQSALKPTVEQLRTGKAAKAIDTMLNEGVNVTPGGVAKLRSKIGDLNQQITDAIASSPATVDKATVASYLRDPLKKFAQQVNPNADMAAIKSAWQEFLDHPLLANSNDIPVQTAQALKQGTYKALGEKSYGELKSAATEAQKTLARGLKEEVAKAVPGIDKLNASESELLNALNVTERRVLQGMNNNPGGLAWLTHNPARFAAFMADKSPIFKSLVARMLYSGSEQIPATAARIGIGSAEAINNQPPQ